jgi:hypothetical protein
LMHSTTIGATFCSLARSCKHLFRETSGRRPLTLLWALVPMHISELAQNLTGTTDNPPSNYSTCCAKIPFQRYASMNCIDAAWYITSSSLSTSSFCNMSQIVLYITLLACKQCLTVRLELKKGVIHWNFPMLRLPNICRYSMTYATVRLPLCPQSSGGRPLHLHFFITFG